MYSVGQAWNVVGAVTIIPDSLPEAIIGADVMQTLNPNVSDADAAGHEVGTDKHLIPTALSAVKVFPCESLLFEDVKDAGLRR